LVDRGAEVLEFPTIRINDPEDWMPVDDAIARLEEYHWVVFTSVNGVQNFFARVRAAGHDARSLAGIKIAAIGPATAQALIDRSLAPDYVPTEYRAEGIVEGFAAIGVGIGSKVLIPRAKEARDVLPDSLGEAGVLVDVVTVYETVLGEGGGHVIERLVQGDIDVVTFTSSSTVKNFMELLSQGLPEGVTPQEVLEKISIASIGPITSDTARSLGLTVDIEAHEFTIPGLVDAVGKLVGRSKKER
jgi:uroporphyrinogen III methyltransferase/synthase